MQIVAQGLAVANFQSVFEAAAVMLFEENSHMKMHPTGPDVRPPKHNATL